jgi:hypothetical protein
MDDLKLHFAIQAPAFVENLCMQLKPIKLIYSVFHQFRQV